MSPDVEHRPHFVYRAYNATGRLLYVGCTVDLRRRWYEHFTPWSEEAETLLVERYPNRTLALHVERIAQETEHPVANDPRMKLRAAAACPDGEPCSHRRAVA